MVASFLAEGLSHLAGFVTMDTAYVNGGLAVIIRVGGAVDTIVAMHTRTA